MSKDIEIIRQLEKQLRIKLKQLDKIDIPFFQTGYVIDKRGNITGLCLYNTQITDLSALKGLTNLTTLYLYNNKITDLSAIKGLTNLTTLYLSYNQITDLSAIKGLTNLTTLYLSSNQIKVLPPCILELRMEIKWEGGWVEGLNLYNNPLETPPVEVIKQGKQAIKRYYEEIEKGEDYLYESKLIVVGEEQAGKTTIRLALSDKNFDFEKSRKEIESTRGIAISDWMIDKENFDEEHSFVFHIWDFGGQEIYHATHQFFLTKRSVYILVQEARKEMRHEDYYFWLNVIELLGEKSPTILILNKCDRPTVYPPVQEYRNRFEFIAGHCEVSCLNIYKNTIQNLGKKLLQIIKDRNLMPHIGEPLPSKWLVVRNEIEKLRQEGLDYISYDDYLSVCLKHNITDDTVFSLIELFHDLGVVMHFRDDLILRNTVFLNYAYVTDAVYKVLDNEKIKKQFGEFTITDLDNIWKESKYRNKQAELLELMKHDNFELCYQIRQCEYMAPQLLAQDMPSGMKDFEKQFEEPVWYEFQYKFMPKGILTRLIVRMRRFLEMNKCWRYGMVVNYDNSLAYIREKYFERKVSIIADGPAKNELLSIIRFNIREINDSFRKLSVEEMVGCFCDECKKLTNQGKEPCYFKRNDLDKRFEKGVDKIECSNSYKQMDVRELLGIAVIEVGTSEQERLYIKNLFMGGRHMEIDKQVNIESRVINAEEVNYIEQNGITKADMQGILEQVHKMAEKDRKMLAEYYQQFENLKSQSDKKSMTDKIKRFLVNYGIAVAQNLTAAGIYDLGKMWLG